jgi:dTDP-glucose 4,6-dehydratase
MSKIIVTGGLGFIGSNFVNYLVDNTNHDVIVVDKMTYASNINNINQEKIKLIVKDICDVTTDDLGDFDYIVHFAAESHVDNSISNGLPFVKTNVEGTFNLLEVSRKNKNLKKFIHISTDEVYGDMAEHFALNHSATETDCLKPSSYYSSTKASSDMLVMSANRTYGLPYLITRTCNNYGGNQHPEKFIPKIIKSIKENIEVPVYGDGKQVREWIHVMDNVKSIYTLMMSDDINQIYNIGSGEHYKNIDLINLISQIIGKDVKFKYVPDRLGHDKKYNLNSLKFKNKFGEIKTINFKDWLKDILIK